MKAKSEMNREELVNAVDNKKAYPDMVLKRLYFDAMESMIEAESQLMYGFYLNGNQYNELDVFRLRSKILKLFGLIKDMIKSNGCLSWDDDKRGFILAKYGVKNDYELCLRLTKYAHLDVDSLTHLSGYLSFCMFSSGLTDLLMDSDVREPNFNELI